MFLTPPDKKTPYYQLVYFRGKKRTKISTHAKDEQEAEKFMMMFEYSKKNNLEFPIRKSKSLPVPTQQDVPKISSMMLSKFKEEYLEYSKQSKTKHSIDSIKLSFNQFIKFTGDLSLNKISAKLVDQFVNTTYARSKSAANLYYRSMKAAFTKAVNWEYIPENPFKKVKAPKVPRAFPSFISIEELNKIIEQEPREFLRNIYSTGFYTGMRLGEILSMKWSWIDLQKNIITVKCNDAFTAKGKKERIVPINPVLRNILVKVIPFAKDDFVFKKFIDVRFNENFVSKSFKKALRKAGIDESIHFHSLRHSFASNLVQKGASLYVVKELLGHEDFKTTQIYSHLKKEDLMVAVNLL